MTAESRERVQLLSRMPRLVDEVVWRLRDSIIDGTFPAGTRLPQVALAEQLGVSRTPLREALRVLENEGLLRTADGNRTVEVVPVSAEDLRDMYELREVIDGLAARLAAAKGLSQVEEQRARCLVSEMAVAAEPYDPVHHIRPHAEFHELIAQASNNAKVQSFRSLIRTSSAALYLPVQRKNISEHPAAPTEQSYKALLHEAQVQHLEIVEAIVARNPAEAEAAARRHIQRIMSLAPYFD